MLAIYVIIKSYINSYFSDIEANEACTRLHHVMWWCDFAVQGHSRSPILGPIESSKASYIKTVARQVLRIKSWIYESARNLYRGPRAVLLQTFTTRQSDRKLSIVMALSTTFMQCAPKTTKFGKITQNKGHFAIQSHSTSPVLVPIESWHTTSY